MTNNNSITTIKSQFSKLLTFSILGLSLVAGLTSSIGSINANAGRGLHYGDILAVNGSEGANLRDENCLVKKTLKNNAPLRFSYESEGNNGMKTCTINGQTVYFFPVEIFHSSYSNSNDYSRYFISQDLVKLIGTNNIMTYTQPKGGKVINGEASNINSNQFKVPDYEAEGKRFNPDLPVTEVDSNQTTEQEYFMKLNEYAVKDISLRDTNCQKTTAKVNLNDKILFVDFSKAENQNVEYEILCNIGGDIMHLIAVVNDKGIKYIPTQVLEERI
jgi:hypothetical protein